MAGWSAAGWAGSGNNGWQQPGAQAPKPSMNYDGTALDWDDEISFSGAGYIVLKPGEYDFTVKSFERGYYNGSQDGKSLPCPTVKMSFEVTVPEGRTVVTHTFFLRKWETSMDFMYNFFVSIGMVSPEQRDAKMAFVPKWNETVGRQGRFVIKNVPKKDDNQTLYNNIKNFVDPPKR